MALHPLAGRIVPPELIIDVDALIGMYYDIQPVFENEAERVSFGTSGHRGSAADARFNENHILAITQAICDYRALQRYTGPVFVGKDTHALSGPAADTAIEVFAANLVETRVQELGGFTPTPVISNAIVDFNMAPTRHKADGVVITPSHNPPRDGGFKYNPPSGGPADSSVTAWIEDRANTYLEDNLAGVRRISLSDAKKSDCVREIDFRAPYIEGLSSVIDMEAIRDSGLSIGADPMGGAGVHYWAPIAEKYGLNLEVVNERVDPTFSFMRVDRDGKIRMDCSSPSAMAGLIELSERFDISFGNDPDFDRHGVVTRTSGLMNPNHYLAVAVDYLFSNRTHWPRDAAVGKTLVSSGMIDRVAASIGRSVLEVPVGFKWFVEGLLVGTLGFAGEESAGASFLRKDGAPWSTDKDGFIMNLLAAEILARTGSDPGVRYDELTASFGAPVYRRAESAVTREQSKVLSNMSADDVTSDRLAGETIRERLTHASGNGAPIGGLKVATENGWFAARPSGTEDIYKIYAESFLGEGHLSLILEEAQQMVADVFKRAGV